MPAGVMTAFKVRELSAVDRPAQAGAVVAIRKRHEMAIDPVIKREFSDKERKALADSGAALPDGSYPIENEADLHNAIRAVGRAKDEAKAKAHIIARAHAMGSTGALPPEWTKKEDGMSKELRKSLGLSEDAADSAVIAALMAKADKSEEDKKKAQAEAEKATRKAAMTEKEKAHTATMSDGDADDFMKKPKEDREAAMAKAAAGDEVLKANGVEIRKSVVGEATFAFMKGQQDQLDRQALALTKAAEHAADATFAKRAVEELAHTSGTVEERAAMLKGIDSISDPVAKAAALKALHTADGISKAAFKTIGSGGSLAKGLDNPEGKLDALAKEIAKAQPTMSFAKAYEKACLDNPDLYTEYRNSRVGSPSDNN